MPSTEPVARKASTGLAGTSAIGIKGTAAGAANTGRSAGARYGATLGVSAGAGNNGEKESAGAVNCAAGANGTPNPLMEATGIAVRVCAEANASNDNKATMTAKQRGLFTISQV